MVNKQIVLVWNLFEGMRFSSPQVDAQLILHLLFKRSFSILLHWKFLSYVR